jgi:hypothetical protein
MRAMALLDLGSTSEISRILMTKITQILIAKPRTLNSLNWITVTSMKTLLQIRMNIHKIGILKALSSLKWIQMKSQSKEILKIWTRTSECTRTKRKGLSMTGNRNIIVYMVYPAIILYLNQPWLAKISLWWFSSVLITQIKRIWIKMSSRLLIIFSSLLEKKKTGYLFAKSSWFTFQALFH